MIQDSDITTNQSLGNKKNPPWVDKFQQYLKDNFKKRNNLWRLLWFAVGLVIVLVPSLTCNLLIREGQWPWPGDVQHNPGIAFGAEMPVPLIYFLQSMICIILLGCILFMKKWYYILPLALAFTGGMFNLFDRVAGFPGDSNTVIDYIPTLWLSDTTSNFPDFSIVGGVIVFAVLYVIFTIIDAFGKNKKAEGDQHGKDPSPKP